MSYQSVLLEREELKEAKELKQELNELEFQMYRMQENIKEIAKRYQVLGIEQTKENSWVVVFSIDDGYKCKIMLSDCETAFQGISDFQIQAKYIENVIHIGDIQGPENKGHGSVCMKYLKEVARDKNIQYITGNIAERDWDHLDRLIHFYKKHNFTIKLDKEDKSGEIWCNP